MKSGEGRSAVDQQNGNVAAQITPWSYRLVVIAILSVTFAFIAIMVIFAWIDVFDKENAANISAAMSSLFGIVGTLVGAYFGIKASSDAQDRLESTHDRALSATQQTADTATQRVTETARQAVTDQKDTAQTAVNRTVTAASQTTEASPRTRGASSMPLVLATLIPLAGSAGFLVLRYLTHKQRNC